MVFDMVSIHPDTEYANIGRPSRSTMVRNNSFGTATFLIWKAILQEWRTIFIRIFINFFLNLANFQWRTNRDGRTADNLFVPARLGKSMVRLYAG